MVGFTGFGCNVAQQRISTWPGLTGSKVSDIYLTLRQSFRDSFGFFFSKYSESISYWCLYKIFYRCLQMFFFSEFLPRMILEILSAVSSDFFSRDPFTNFMKFFPWFFPVPAGISTVTPAFWDSFWNYFGYEFFLYFFQNFLQHTSSNCNGCLWEFIWKFLRKYVSGISAGFPLEISQLIFLAVFTEVYSNVSVGRSINSVMAFRKSSRINYWGFL